MKEGGSGGTIGKALRLYLNPGCSNKDSARPVLGQNDNILMLLVTLLKLINSFTFLFRATGLKAAVHQAPHNLI